MPVASRQLPVGLGPRPRAWALALGLALMWGGPLSAQRGVRQRLGAGAPADNTGANAGLVQQLYAQARRAVYAAPALLAPRMLTEIATDEWRPFRRRQGAADQGGPDQGGNEAARADFRTAFALAMALPSPGGDSAMDKARAQVKAQVEEQAVAELARHGYAEQALELTRSADVARQQMYGDLIAALVRSRWRRQQQAKTASDAAPPPPPLLERALALVNECERSGAGYPYRGVAELLQAQRRRSGDDGSPDTAAAPGDGLARMELVQDGYGWAGRERDAARMQNAVNFLAAGHRGEPELDSLLESALSSLLDRMGGQTDTDGAETNAASRALALLRRIAPLQAAGMSARWPALSSAAPQAMGAGGGGNLPVMIRRGGSRRPQLSYSATVTAPAPDPNQQSVGGMRFRVLVAEAESLHRSHPHQALSYANQAGSLLNQQLWATAAPEATRLAMVYQELGSAADAARLLSHALDEADRQARAVDDVFEGQQPDQQAQMAEDPGSAQSTVLDIYSLAARLDFATTAARAEGAGFRVLKPLVLARVALVGTVSPRRGRRGTVLP